MWRRQWVALCSQEYPPRRHDSRGTRSHMYRGHLTIAWVAASKIIGK